MMPRVLIAGAGPTGAICAHILRRELKEKVQIEVWDKSRGTGGRMSTSRVSDNPQCLADLGAQYFTVTPHFAETHSSFHQELLENGITKEFTGGIEGMKNSKYPDGTRHYVTPQGVSTAVKYFLQISEAETHFLQGLTSLSVLSKDSKTSLQATSDAKDQNTHQRSYDAVILTMPIPQLLKLGGSVKEKLAENPSIKSNLEAVLYSSRYALGLFFPEGVSIDAPWDAKYVKDNPCICWVSIDNKKRGISTGSSSVVVHTSVPFGIKYLETDKADVQPIILEELQKILPTIPQPSSVKCIRWRYSQVLKSYKGSPGTLVLDEGPSHIILAAGDGFMHSNLDGCIESALITCQRLIEHWNRSSQL